MEQKMYSHHVKAVGSVAKQRERASNLNLLIRRVFLAAEYIGYILTFYILMSQRVLPTYENVNQYNPLAWAKDVPVFDDYVLFLAIMLIIHAFTLVQKHLFSGQAERSYLEEYFFVFRSILYAFLITTGITFLLKTTFFYSRLTLVLFIVFLLIESLIWLAAQRWVVNYLNRSGLIKSHILIVGAGKVGADVYSSIIRSQYRRNHFVGYLDDFKKGVDIRGKTSDLEKILQQSRVDTIYITIPSERHIIESILHTVYKYNVDIRIIPEMFDRMATVFSFRNDLEYPCLQIVKTPLRGMNIYLKRYSDICSSLFLMVVLSPLFILLCLLIKLDSKGPMFFKQERIGKNGVPFRMVKFRSMHQEAEVMRATLNKDNHVTGPAFKMRNDPRITKIGRTLRKYSLDELPQIWNVLKGEMSLIGPRPPLPEEVEKYTDYHWRRMDVRPGMTGLWQVSGRSNLNFEEWIDLDIYYIERWSLILEMKILFKTIPAVIKGTGAY
jgi:exopolysaccharide biosynthesis polyprenyl glycosylphosphotransferase